jgi:N-acetylmuramoyl-L-alanine amidase
VLAAISLLLCPLVWLHRDIVHAQAGEQSLSVISSRTNYSVPLLEVKSQSYVGLVELLEPLGTVDARVDGRKYRLHFTGAGGPAQEVQFTDGKNKGKIGGNGYKLSADFVLRDGRGYIPLTAAGDLTGRLLSQPAQLHAAARRLFVGVTPVHFSAELHQENPSRLIVHFPSPVNPSVSSEPGGIRFTFRREPVVSSGSDTTSYHDPLITGTNFGEQDGIAELNVTATAPLIASFADGGKTIIVTAAPVVPPSIAQAPPPVQPEVLSNAQSNAPRLQVAAPPRFLVLIDPAHGGSDIGAAITPSLPEKDVVLALAFRLRHELVNRGIACTVLRNSDASISLDQRAAAANATRPALYIALHAANTGKGVHVFTSLLPAENLSPQGFLPWDTAQAAFLELSNTVAGSVAAELESRQLPNTTLVAPLRPMSSVAAPAVAVEIAPLSTDAEEIASPGYQQQVAQSIAAGVAAVRAKLPEVRP